MEDPDIRVGDRWFLLDTHVLMYIFRKKPMIDAPTYNEVLKNNRENIVYIVRDSIIDYLNFMGDECYYKVNLNNWSLPLEWYILPEDLFWFWKK